MQKSDGKILFTNNSRKMKGVPLRRKKDRRKREYTRNRADEDIQALLDWWDGSEGGKNIEK